MNHVPSLFVSHGAPTFALEPGVAGPKLTALGRALPRPKAVLVVSPHWITRGVRVGTSARPETIYDFGGFARELYEIRYPAQGHPGLAARAVERLRGAGWDVAADPNRGLDHGAWVPLRYLYPDADVPVFQVSLPVTLDTRSAFELGATLRPLAEDGVLVVGSGSLTHNLREFFEAPANDTGYVTQFARWVRKAVEAGDAERLIAAVDDSPHGRRAHPTPEHFWPLLVAAGAAPSLTPSTLVDGGVVHDILAMDSFVFGAALPVQAGFSNATA